MREDMGNKIIEINPDHPNLRNVKKAVEVLQEGGIISYPTDTIYGLGANIEIKSAVERIYQIKKISNYKLLSFICLDIKDITNYAYISNRSYKIMKRCLPGPFTFILPATSKTPKLLNQKRGTVGIRIPKSELCRQLVELLGKPIISTSVPAGADEVLNDPLQIDRRIGDQLDLILDGGILISEPSTIVDLTADEPLIIRQGKGDGGLVY
jgi:tRNA threonylcarbamoyl adenosine modification protein (Sua5/YciO/YrdC/YwlC family)